MLFGGIVKNYTSDLILRTKFKKVIGMKKKFVQNMEVPPNERTTSNRCRFDVDITSIRRRPNFDEFPRRFHVLFRCNFSGRKIHVVSRYFFRCNFDGRKIHVVSTYFFRCNFDGRKIHLVYAYFFRCNFFRRNIHGVPIYFFRRNFDGRIIRFVCKYFFRQSFDEFDVAV